MSFQKEVWNESSGLILSLSREKGIPNNQVSLLQIQHENELFYM